MCLLGYFSIALVTETVKSFTWQISLVSITMQANYLFGVAKQKIRVLSFCDIFSNNSVQRRFRVNYLFFESYVLKQSWLWSSSAVMS